MSRPTEESTSACSSSGSSRTATPDILLSVQDEHNNDSRSVKLEHDDSLADAPTRNTRSTTRNKSRLIDSSDSHRSSGPYRALKTRGTRSTPYKPSITNERLAAVGSRRKPIQQTLKPADEKHIQQKENDLNESNVDVNVPPSPENAPTDSNAIQVDAIDPDMSAQRDTWKLNRLLRRYYQLNIGLDALIRGVAAPEPINELNEKATMDPQLREKVKEYNRSINEMFSQFHRENTQLQEIREQMINEPLGVEEETGSRIAFVQTKRLAEYAHAFSGLRRKIFGEDIKFEAKRERVETPDPLITVDEISDDDQMADLNSQNSFVVEDMAAASPSDSECTDEISDMTNDNNQGETPATVPGSNVCTGSCWMHCRGGHDLVPPVNGQAYQGANFYNFHAPLPSVPRGYYGQGPYFEPSRWVSYASQSGGYIHPLPYQNILEPYNPVPPYLMAPSLRMPNNVWQPPYSSMGMLGRSPRYPHLPRLYPDPAFIKRLNDAARQAQILHQLQRERRS